MFRYQIDCPLIYFLKTGPKICRPSPSVFVTIVESENSPQALLMNHQKRKLGAQRKKPGLLTTLFISCRSDTNFSSKWQFPP